MRKNRFLSNIENGSIPDVSVLKERYRSLVMQTHPDRAGASRIGEFIGLEDDYQEALRLLHARRGMTDLREENVRLLFFQELRKIDGLQSPYCLDKDAAEERLLAARSKAERYFCSWRGEGALFAEAMKENDMLKHEKQRNTLAELYKPPDHQRIRPLAFSLTYFHLTGQAFYRMQIQRLKKPVLHRLLERGCNSLKDYYALLIDDAADGPAIDG